MVDDSAPGSPEPGTGGSTAEASPTAQASSPAQPNPTAEASTTSQPTSTAQPSLAGWRVLVPRAPGRGAGLARLVEQAGGSAVVAPLVSRAEIDADDRALLDSAVRDLAAGRTAWVAVTSVNAVDELVASAGRVLEHEQSDPVHEDATAAGPQAHGTTHPLAVAGQHARWAAVGPATARALAAVGITVDLVATENSAVGLLAEWPDAEVGLPAAGVDRVLLPLGDLARPTLEVGLRERGYVPIRVTTYRTVSHPAPPEVVADWRDGRFDAVVLTSGSVAREVAEQLGPRGDVQAIAIGEPTRRAAVEAGQAVAAVARTADDDGLLSALVAARHANPGARPGVFAGPPTP